ncbi:hypothetical protein AAC387_Pa06g1703 [Persea americana]
MGTDGAHLPEVSQRSSSRKDDFEGFHSSDPGKKAAPITNVLKKRDSRKRSDVVSISNSSKEVERQNSKIFWKSYHLERLAKGYMQQNSPYYHGSDDGHVDGVYFKLLFSRAFLLSTLDLFRVVLAGH